MLPPQESSVSFLEPFVGFTFGSREFISQQRISTDRANFKNAFKINKLKKNHPFSSAHFSHGIFRRNQYGAHEKTYAPYANIVELLSPIGGKRWPFGPPRGQKNW